MVIFQESVVSQESEVFQESVNSVISEANEKKRDMNRRRRKILNQFITRKLCNSLLDIKKHRNKYQTEIQRCAKMGLIPQCFLFAIKYRFRKLVLGPRLFKLEKYHFNADEISDELERCIKIINSDGILPKILQHEKARIYCLPCERYRTFYVVLSIHSYTDADSYRYHAS